MRSNWSAADQVYYRSKFFYRVLLNLPLGVNDHTYNEHPYIMNFHKGLNIQLNNRVSLMDVSQQIELYWFRTLTVIYVDLWYRSN